MAITQEQLKQLDALAKTQGGADSQQFKDYVNIKMGAGSYDKLKDGIKQVSQAGGVDAYNKSITPAPIKQYNIDARDLTLNSQPAVSSGNLKTTVNTDEATKMAQSGIKDMGNVGLDLNGTTKKEFANEVKTNLKETPTSTTDITYNEDKNPYDANKVISKAPQFTGADGKTYQTVRNSDNTLTTIDVSTGQPVTGKYTDAERDSIKQGFLTSPEDKQQDEIKQQEEKMKYDPDTLFSQIQSGITVPKEVQNSNEYKNQLIRSENLARYEKKTAPDLSKDIISGRIIPGSQVYNDLKLKNPQLIADAEKLVKLNSSLVRDEGSKTENTQIAISDIVKKMLAPSDIPKATDALSKDEDISTWNTEMADIEDQMKEKKRALQTLKKDIEKEFEGTGATKGYINAIISERSEQITNDYNNLLDDYNTVANKLDRKTKLITEEINYQKQAEAEKMQKLQLAYGIMSDELNYKRGIEATQEERAYQQEIIKEQRAYEEATNIPTSIIQVGNKNVLINTQTGQEIKSFDMPTEATKTDGLIKMGDDSLYDTINNKWITKTSSGNTTSSGSTTSSGYSIKFEPKNNYTGYADVINNDLKRVGSDGVLNGDMIEQAGNEYGVNPALIAGIIRNDSANGTKVYSQYNYGNVGNNDTLVASGGKGVAFNTPQEGVNAVAENIRKRIDAYKSVFGANSNPSIKELLTGVANNGNKFFGVYMTDKTGPARVESIAKSLDKGTKIPRQTGGQTVGYDTNKIADYAAYNQNKLPSAQKTLMIKDGTFDDFQKEATAYKKELLKQAAPSTASYIDSLIKLRDGFNSYYNRMEALAGLGDYGTIYKMVTSENALKEVIELKQQGGSLGQMTDKDLQFIKDNANSSLGLTQSEKQFKENISKLIKSANNIYKEATGKDYTQTIGNTQNIDNDIMNSLNQFYNSNK